MSYQILQPGVLTYRDGRECCDRSLAGRREYKRRVEEMRQRQGCKCAMCQRVLYEGAAQFDHEAGRGSGGGHRDDRIEVDGEWVNAAMCADCNGKKGSRRYTWQDGLYLPLSP